MKPGIKMLRYFNFDPRFKVSNVSNCDGVLLENYLNYNF